MRPSVAEPSLGLGLKGLRLKPSLVPKILKSIFRLPLCKQNALKLYKNVPKIIG